MGHHILQMSLIYRSSLPEEFLWKSVLKIYSKFTGENPWRSGISIKLLYNFIEITLRNRCSPLNLPHIFRSPIPKNTSGGLLLYITKLTKQEAQTSWDLRHQLKIWFKWINMLNLFKDKNKEKNSSEKFKTLSNI